MAAKKQATDEKTITVKQIRSTIATKPKTAARCARSASQDRRHQHAARSARDPRHDRPGPSPITVDERRADMQVHDLAPAPGSTRPSARRPRHRRQGRQDRRPRHQGPAGARNTGRPRLRRWPDAAEAARAEAEGLQQPVPRRVPGGQPRRLDDLGDSTMSIPRRAVAKGLVRKGAFVKVLARGEITTQVNVTAHGVSKAAEAAITAAGGSVTLVAAALQAGSPARSRATSSPTADSRSTTTAVTPTRCRSLAVLSNLKNVFKVTDLRNKILFVMCHDRPVPAGRRHPRARHRPRRRQAVQGRRRISRARSAS